MNHHQCWQSESVHHIVMIYNFIISHSRENKIYYKSGLEMVFSKVICRDGSRTKGLVWILIIQNSKIWNLKIRNLSILNLKIENLKIRNSKIRNLKIQNLKIWNLKIRNWKLKSERAFIPTGVRFENFFGTYLCRQSTLVLDVQP